MVFPPILALVYVGIGQEEDTYCGYTLGLTNFGKDEVIITGSDLPQIQRAVLDVASHVIVTGAVIGDQELTLASGHTLSFTRHGDGEDAVLRAALPE